MLAEKYNTELYMLKHAQDCIQNAVNIEFASDEDTKQRQMLKELACAAGIIAAVRVSMIEGIDIPLEDLPF